jgi:murein DD-endopeptidase MepM/ murein hydrolase activator NlpD
VYTVAEGDTVSSIGAKFGISAEYIVANNAEIQDADYLAPGQSLLIPAGDGILHEVKLGETLSDIATKYAVDVATIAAFPANHIAEANNITETELIYVPGATIPAPVAAPLAGPSPTPEVAPTPEPPPVPADGGEPSPAAPADPTEGVPTEGGDQGDPSGVAPGETTPSAGKGLIWPVVGPISSCYCPWHPLGIDIDGYALEGAPVVASTAGTVIFAGGNACCSYGLYVVVMSPDGIETLYAHLASLSVEQGQTVAQGDALGIIGSTGYATGTHLHFEVIDNGVRQNPLDYLPGTAACEPEQCG